MLCETLMHKHFCTLMYMGAEEVGGGGEIKKGREMKKRGGRGEEERGEGRCWEGGREAENGYQ